VEPAEPTDVFDFLYRDASRIASYYAQLFSGLPKSSENLGQSKQATETTIKGSVSVAGAERKSIKDIVTSRKEVVDPHDTITIDMIAKLLGRAATGPAGNNSLVRAEGTLLLTDGSAIKAFSSLDEKRFVKLILKDQPPKDHKAKMQADDDAKNARDFMRGLDFPSMFLLRTAAGREYMGTLKPAGLEEPIGSFLARHGDGGLPGVTVVGIQEQSTPALISEAAALLSASAKFAGVLRKMFFPDNVTPVTPIAIYRRLSG
jgi:hypothetical protein